MYDHGDDSCKWLPHVMLYVLTKLWRKLSEAFLARSEFRPIYVYDSLSVRRPVADHPRELW